MEYDGPTRIWLKILPSVEVENETLLIQDDDILITVDGRQNRGLKPDPDASRMLSELALTGDSDLDETVTESGCRVFHSGESVTAELSLGEVTVELEGSVFPTSYGVCVANYSGFVGVTVDGAALESVRREMFGWRSTSEYLEKTPSRRPALSPERVARGRRILEKRES